MIPDIAENPNNQKKRTILLAGAFRRLKATGLVAAITEWAIGRRATTTEGEYGFIDGVLVALGINQFDGAFYQERSVIANADLRVRHTKSLRWFR